jgi:hypothetical protein
MSELSATFSVFILFLIRLGLPFLILALVSYGLHRLQAHWQQEAQGPSTTTRY